MQEYVIRSKRLPDGRWTASLRRFAGCAHPEVRAVLGPVAIGYGATEPAAMLSAICASRVETAQTVREVRSVS